MKTLTPESVNDKFSKSKFVFELKSWSSPKKKGISNTLLFGIKNGIGFS